MIRANVLFRALLAPLLALTLVACGGGSSSPPPVPPSDGTMAYPVDLGQATAPLSFPGQVGPNGSSYYLFTTGSIPGPNVIALTGTRSDLSWSLMAWDALSQSWVQLDVCDNVLGVGNEICVTGSLAANSNYMVIVDEWNNVASTYTLTITPPSAPQNEGSPSAPLDLGVATAPLLHLGTVGANGSSYYWFTTGSISGSHAIALTGTQSDLSWTLEGWDAVSQAWVSLNMTCDNVVGATGDEICATGTLASNSDYRLIVDEWLNAGSNFALQITPP